MRAAPRGGARGCSEYTRKKDDSGEGNVGKEEREREREREESEQRGTALSLANASPSTSSLLREEHEKSNVSIFRPSPIPPGPRSFSATPQSSLSFSLPHLAQYSHEANVVAPRDKFLQLEPSTATDR